MASSEPPKIPTVAGAVKNPSGAVSALRYTGIPPSWFQKRPKLPSRNWLIFWSLAGSVTSLYIYDRRTAKRIRQEYVEKVQWRAEEKLNPMEFPRKVRVYGCRWPGDDDHDRSMKYFRRYVKVSIQLLVRPLTKRSMGFSLSLLQLRLTLKWSTETDMVA